MYAASSENVLADALSHLYSNDSPGTVRAQLEFTQFDMLDEEPADMVTQMPLLAGLEAVVATHQGAGAESGCPETLKEFAQ